MDWILTSGDTVEDAKEIALEKLSVTMEDVEFQIISEAKKSFFGFKRNPAQIRARLKPLTPPKKLERVYKGKKSRYEAKKPKSSGSNKTSNAKKSPDVRKDKNQSSVKNVNKPEKVEPKTVSRSRTINTGSIKPRDLNETKTDDGLVRRKRTLSGNSVKDNDVPKSTYSKESPKKMKTPAIEKPEVSNSDSVTTKRRTRKIAQ
ncbi:MAG: Jag N-terminal domain-containing protein [Acidimicrobiales bacterium]|jgi:spoIIIJ-associated protein|tara:strand:- start:1303 stop:1911 length:609 start_codon:yes stop_codon:yes gene_type:complete